MPPQKLGVNPMPTKSDVTVVVVAYAVVRLDLAWVPPEAYVIVVHNDDALEEASVSHPRARHLHLPRNVGFGAAVNRALPLITTARVILANPDMTLTRQHWYDLVGTGELECRTLRMDTPDGRPTVVLAKYPSPIRFVLMAWRLRHRFRRLAPTGSPSRDEDGPPIERFSVADRWLSGALLSMPVGLLRSVGGFDEELFLYYEDLDLFQRIAQAVPDVEVSVVDPSGGRPVHLVGGTSTGSASRVARIRLASALHWARKQPGIRWRLATRLGGLARFALPRSWSIP